MVESAPRLSLPSIVVNPVSVQRTDHCEKRGGDKKASLRTTQYCPLHHCIIFLLEQHGQLQLCRHARLPGWRQQQRYIPAHSDHGTSNTTTHPALLPRVFINKFEESNNLQHATRNITTTPKQQHHHITRLPKRTTRPRAVVTTVQCQLFCG